MLETPLILVVCHARAKMQQEQQEEKKNRKRKEKKHEVKQENFWKCDLIKYQVENLTYCFLKEKIHAQGRINGVELPCTYISTPLEVQTGKCKKTDD